MTTQTQPTTGKPSNIINFPRERCYSRPKPGHGFNPVLAEPLTTAQRVELSQAIDQALRVYWDCYSPSVAANWAWNRLRVRFNVLHVDDLRQDQFEDALQEVVRMAAGLAGYLDFREELKLFITREVIGAGTPWTPAVARAWRKKMRASLPERPDWLAMAKAIGPGSVAAAAEDES